MARHDDRLDKPGAPGYRIKTLTAFIAKDPSDDSEDIISYTNPLTREQMPLIGADDARVMQLRPLAEQVAAAMDIPVVLARFTVREDVETLG